MKVDLPDINRCCCCIPLRYGLIAWAFIKLLFFLLLLISTTAVQFCGMLMYHVNTLLSEKLLYPFIMVVLIVDILFTMLFLCAGHVKSLRLMKVFYIYNIVMLCIMTVIYVTATIFALYMTGVHVDSSLENNSQLAFWFKVNFLWGLLMVGLEAYFVLMVRSEVRKLTNNCDFRFSNNATEAECVMQNETLAKEDAKEDEINVNEMIY